MPPSLREESMVRTVSLVVMLLVLAGCKGKHEGPGTITSGRIPPEDLAARAAAQTSAREHLPAVAGAPSGDTKQILFGDLHVHTTLSPHPFVRSRPMLQGEGAPPPAPPSHLAPL